MLAEHESEGNDEELIALVVTDMQNPVTPIREAALASESPLARVIKPDSQWCMRPPLSVLT
jgi:hypothetical protein